MGINKSLQCILPSCFNAKITHNIVIRSNVSTHNSSPRISLSDISDHGSPLCLSDLANSKFRPNLHIFSHLELKVMTSDFSVASFLGEGGFGPVHKGFVDECCRPGLAPQPVAVKLLDPNGDQGHREWLTEVVLLGQLKHPHLVNLIGYCCEDEHRLLVYEYMANGNLGSRLFQRYASLAWESRIKIALGAARGLAFLHGKEKPVIYCDFKTSNILLDSDCNAKLSDFGLAKDGLEGDETQVSTRIMGTYGYAAPEYLLKGHLTTKIDVYSFGVVLLELLTGRRAIDNSRSPREQNLVDWGKPYLKDLHKLYSIVDQRLQRQYSSEGARRVAALARQCLNHSPKVRPTMSHVVKILERIVQFSDDVPFVYIAPVPGKEDAKINGRKKDEDEDEDKGKAKKETGRKQMIEGR